MASVLQSDLDRFLEPLSAIRPPVMRQPIVYFANGAEPRSVGKCKEFEGISPVGIGFAVVVEHIVDPDTDESIAPVPALDDLVPGPFAVRRFLSDKHRGDARVFELVVNPALDRVFALPLDRFPFNAIDESVFVFAGDDVAVADLAGQPSVAFVME